VFILYAYYMSYQETSNSTVFSKTWQKESHLNNEVYHLLVVSDKDINLCCIQFLKYVMKITLIPCPYIRKLFIT